MATKQQAKPAPTTAEMHKGAHGVFETVTVEGEAGPMRINAHEHDEEVHGKAIEPKKTAGKKAHKKASGEELEGMTKEELMKELDKQGVEYQSHATKDELLKLAQKGA